MSKELLPVWNLSAIRPASLKSSCREIEKTTASIEKKGKTIVQNPTPFSFLHLIKELEELKRKAAQLGCFVSLHFAEDSSDQKAAAELSQVENFLTQINNRLLFLDIWFKNLPEDKARPLIQASGKYAYHWELLRKNKPYTLKENEEKIINIKDLSGITALNKVYQLLTSQFDFEFQGQKLTQEELLVKVRDSSPVVREAAYRALFLPYRKHKNVLGEIYRSLANDWREENLGLRGYQSPLHVRNVANDLPDKAVETLLAVCQKNQPLFQRFFELKRKRLKLKKMRRFDLYAPVEEKKTNKISYEQAVKLILETHQSFSPLFKESALKIMGAQHIHSKIQKNKQPGAFCCGITTEIPPYILLNYAGTLRDVSTLAHELGHGIHYLLASKQTEFTCEASLPLAETASIFSEMLLSEQLMKKEPAKAKELLFFKLDDLYASIIRQAGFVVFEKKAHQMIREGRTLEEISQAYLADLRKQLGPKVEVDELFADEWCYIPHIFHTPFYCYAYAFGNLLVLALYGAYREKGPSFAPKIIEMLAKGGSESPIAITKAIGVDICSEEFWQKGFDAIEKMVGKIE